MKTKLTLSIDEKKVRKIKEYAKQNETSVSNLVEEHFEKLITSKTRQKLDASKLLGIFGRVPKNFNWKKERTDYLIKKHGL